MTLLDLREVRMKLTLLRVPPKGVIAQVEEVEGRLGAQVTEVELQKARASLLRLASDSYPIGVNDDDAELVADILHKAFVRINRLYLEKRRLRKVAEAKARMEAAAKAKMVLGAKPPVSGSQVSR